MYTNIILLHSLPSWLKYFEGGSVPIVRLEQTPGRVIQNDYKSCNMDVRIDTSRSPLLLFSPIPPYSSGFQGSDRVVGARPTGLDWLTRLAWSQPTSPWFSPASFHIPHPPFLPQNSPRNDEGGKRDSWLVIFSKDGATCTESGPVCHLINKRDAT